MTRDFRSFYRSLQPSAEVYLKSGHGHFLNISFQFVILTDPMIRRCEVHMEHNNQLRDVRVTATVGCLHAIRFTKSV
jgi:hypothetical protein